MCVRVFTALASHDYILKIVPTVYEDLSGRKRFSYQYTVANKVHRGLFSRLFFGSDEVTDGAWDYVVYAARRHGSPPTYGPHGLPCRPSR